MLLTNIKNMSPEIQKNEKAPLTFKSPEEEKGFKENVKWFKGPYMDKIKELFVPGGIRPDLGDKLKHNALRFGVPLASVATLSQTVPDIISSFASPESIPALVFSTGLALLSVMSVNSAHWAKSSKKRVYESYTQKTKKESL